MATSSATNLKSDSSSMNRSYGTVPSSASKGSGVHGPVTVSSDREASTWFYAAPGFSKRLGSADPRVDGFTGLAMVKPGGEGLGSRSVGRIGAAITCDASGPVGMDFGHGLTQKFVVIG